MELGSTREVPGVTRPLVSREVRSDSADVCGQGSDASDIEAIPFTFLNFTTLKKPITCVMHGGESWEPLRRAEAASRIEQGKLPITSRTLFVVHRQQQIRESLHT